jgi:alpha-glucosidase
VSHQPESVPWWRDAVVYQIYPRSFADGNGDGIGDLEGLRAHLDHVADLGADAIWTSPIYPSPMADNGYDVSDYCDIDPVFGDLATFDQLLSEAHARGLRLILDWVPNHTSDRHPWFVDSRSSSSSSRRDWYYWRDATPTSPPNNWQSTFGGSAWTWDEATGQSYLHLFLPQQPDLNWNNPHVREAMHATLRFWLDRGVDGFRMDVVHLIGKDPALPSLPPGHENDMIVTTNDDPRAHEYLRSIRLLLDSYPGDRMAVGEVNLRDTRQIAGFYGANDELHLVFNFLTLDCGWDAAAWASFIRTIETVLPADAWPTWVLSNHDVKRLRTRLGGSLPRARALAVLLLTLRGTPFVYAGDELGLEDADVPPDRRVDPVGRDGCRAPLPWTAAAQHGWNAHEPWLPFPPEAGTHNVETESADERSTLHLYRRLLRHRRASPALRRGELELLDAPAGVVCFRRTQDTDERIVVVNFTGAAATVPLDGRYVVAVGSDDRVEPTSYDASVPAETAVVLAPA